MEMEKRKDCNVIHMHAALLICFHKSEWPLTSHYLLRNDVNRKGLFLSTILTLLDNLLSLAQIRLVCHQIFQFLGGESQYQSSFSKFAEDEREALMSYP